MTPDLIRPILLVVALACLAAIALKSEYDNKRRWAMFYGSLYATCTIPLANHIAVASGLWIFVEDDLPSLLIPYDILFLWVIAWGIIPAFFLRKWHIPLVIGCVLWIDMLLMPLLEGAGILILYDHWLFGELALLIFTFIPGYLWMYASYHQIWTGLRAALQVVVVVCLYIIGLPYLMAHYGLISDLHYTVDSLLLQLLLIVTFPGLVAVVDLVVMGQGTPFPFDKTRHLVTHGIYTYIRNPIQWSFALVSVPLAIYHESWYLLIGLPMSIFYSLSIADVQEYADMEDRFGDNWTAYKKSVPKWYFSWVPRSIPVGTVYFDTSCTHCSRLSSWYAARSAQNLNIKAASEYSGTTLRKVTYVDHTGNHSHGTRAIALSLEHINLAYATLGWFMRFLVICYLMDAIVYSMDYGDEVKRQKQKLR